MPSPRSEELDPREAVIDGLATSLARCEEEKKRLQAKLDRSERTADELTKYWEER